MIVSPQIVAAAKRRADRHMAPQYVPVLGHFVNTDDLVGLLADRTSPAAQRASRAILRDMSLAAWCVVAAIHSNKRDPTPHIRVSVGGIEYHLRLDARGCIFDIYRRNWSSPRFWHSTLSPSWFILSGSS